MHAVLSVDVSDSLKNYMTVRQRTCDFVAGLSDADATVQSMEDASPAKWHLAHTTWFFETFILVEFVDGYEVFDTAYNYLFNSYYEAVGARHQRARRGMLTRPSLEQIMKYRVHVDVKMTSLIESNPSPVWDELLQLGLNHEQQHQELLLTDILHLFSQNPLQPAFTRSVLDKSSNSVDLSWKKFKGGIYNFGHKGNGFAFDCEMPHHQALLQDFEIANRAVTNGEWISFIEDGGYQEPRWWLSDGWAFIQNNQIISPLYWQDQNDHWQVMSLHGLKALNLSAPVSNVSYYEADAYASWAGVRLPTEYEWEQVARSIPVEGNLAELSRFEPETQGGEGILGLFGDVWEWTSSPYTPYPGFKASDDAVGEYNGKFMSGQMVLRGGSFATPSGHIRSTYRNFFQPDKRWQFSGLRLARDC